tara:strand:- start:229 stop:909 length:681 start_codon:yes stop_codon:yes gene_type:complete
MKNNQFKYFKVLGLICLTLLSRAVLSFELLSEGAMGSVSAISANTAEEIVNVAGSSAAGLRIDDGYEVLPFKTSVKVDTSDKDEVSNEIDFSLVKEVDSWVDSLRQRAEVANSSALEVGYIDELPASSFDESSFVIRDDEFDRVIFEPKSGSANDEQESEIYELGRVEQAITKLEQNVDSVQYIVERKIDFVATVDASPDNQQSIGSGYIANLTSISNVKIAEVRD